MEDEYRALGSPVPETTFPVVDVVTETSSARPSRQIVSARAGREWVSSEWFDAEREETCALTAFGAGKYRCAPAANFVGWVFADSGCTRHLWQGTRGGCPPAYTSSRNYDVCPSQLALYKIGEPHSGPVFGIYRIDDMNGASLRCLPYDPLPSDAVFFTTSAIDEEQFPPLEVVTAP